MTVWLKRLMVTWYADRVCILNAERERRKEGERKFTSGNWPVAKTCSKHVFPQAPSPTITSFFETAAAAIVWCN